MAIVNLDGTYNVRTPGARYAPDVFRGASLDGLTPDGIAAFAALDISVVIDLRESQERGPVRHNTPVIHIPIYRLPDGPPLTGTLEAVYERMIRTRGPELTAAVAAVADSTGPVFVHCSAGKDRTGLVLALALLAVGTPLREVIADYVQSAQQVAPHRRNHTVSVLSNLSLTDAEQAASLRLHLGSPEGALRHALVEIDSRGGSAAYLTSHGLTPAQLDRLRSRLVGAGARGTDE